MGERIDGDRKNDQPCQPLGNDPEGTTTLEGPVSYSWITEGDKAQGSGDQDPEEMNRDSGYLQDGDEFREWSQTVLKQQARCDDDNSLWDWTAE